MPQDETPNDESIDSNSSTEHDANNTGEAPSAHQEQLPPASGNSASTDNVNNSGKSDSEARMLGALSHGLGIVAPVLAPLIIWLVKREDLPQIDRPCKEALNFQITWCIVLIIIATPSTCIPFFACLGLPVLGLLGVGVMVLQIIATVAAAEGRDYRYPINVRIL